MEPRITETVYGDKFSLKMAKSRKRRYEIERRQTTRNETEVIWKWHVTGFHGKNGSSSYGYIEPDPGPDAVDERLVRCATQHGLHNATIPVIIRRELTKDRLGRLLEGLVVSLWGNQFASLNSLLVKLPETVREVEIDDTLSAEICAAIRWHRYYVEHMLPNLS